jgi:hypothetical protein
LLVSTPNSVNSSIFFKTLAKYTSTIAQNNWILSSLLLLGALKARCFPLLLLLFYKSLLVGA